MEEISRNEEFQISCKSFTDLLPIEVYKVLQLRIKVFIVEQNFIFQDADDKDYISHHVMIWNNGNLVAYARLVPPKMKFEEASIGRVVTSTEYRGQGHGKRIVQFALEKCHNLFGYGPIRVGAQLYLKQFYQEFGFSAIGDIYVENNIEHIDMIKSTIIS